MNSQCRSQQSLPTAKVSEVVFILVAYLATQVFVMAMSDYLPGNHPMVLASLASAWCAAIAAVAAGAWINRMTGGRVIGRGKVSRLQGLACAIGAVLVAFGGDWITSAVPDTGPVNPLLAAAYMDKGLAIQLWWIVGTILVVPIGEEMVFRGALQPYLATRIGNGFAILLAALCFVAMHLSQLDGYWPAMVAIFSLGVAAGVARWRTGSIYGAILVHVAYNSTVMVSILGAQS